MSLYQNPWFLIANLGIFANISWLSPKNKLMQIFLSYGMLCWPCCLSCIFATLHINDIILLYAYQHYPSVQTCLTPAWYLLLFHRALRSWTYSILLQQKENYNEVTVDWQHTIIYLLWVDVSGCCAVGSKVRVSQARQKGFFFFVFVHHFCGNIKNTWVLDRKEEGQWKWMSLNTDECRTLIMSIHSKPPATVLIEQQIFLRCQDVGPLP